MPEGCKYIRLVKTAIRVKVQFICEVENIDKRSLDEPIGLDSGITNRVAFSDETTEPGIKLNRKELKRKQRALNRAKKESNNRKKKVIAHAKEWERTTDRENNAIHRLTSKAVKKCNHIAMEDLQITNMVKNPYLSRSITEQQWGKIKWQFTYKAESAGGKLGLVSPHYTTRTCSNCGKINPKLPLSQRVFNCIYCGYTEDKDINASKNVRNKYKLMSGGTVVCKQFPMSAVNINYRRDRGNRGTLHSEQLR